MCSFESKKYPAIIVTVYDRGAHIKKCLESLERAIGADSYHVIIGSDAPVKDEHLGAVESVREYLRSKQKNHGFKKMTLNLSEKNLGQVGNIEICNSIAQGEGHESFIMMEDDVVVGKGFLNFMARGLKKFAEDEKVISINGYLHPDTVIQDGEPFLYNRFCAYGFASWYTKWSSVLHNIDTVNYAKIFLADKKLLNKMVKYSPHAKSYPFLAERYYRAWDLEIGLMMELEGLWVVVPPISLTANKGMDGSGLRSGFDPRLQKIEANDDDIDFLTASYNKVTLDVLKGKATRKNMIYNWVSTFIYNYIPFGFAFLKIVRSILKKS